MTLAAQSRARARHAPRADRLRVRLDPLRAVVCLIIILVVSRVHQYVPPLAKARPLLILIVIAAVYAFANPRLLIRESVFSTWPAKVIAGLGIAAVLAVPFGISMGNSGKFVLEVYWKNLLLAFLVVGVRDAE